MIGQSLLDRVLHRFALQNRAFRRFYFKRECERNQLAFDRQRQNVFIVGMARAGSTTLLNAIYDSGQFAATTYADMPFILAPSLARLIDRLRQTPVARRERAHADGIEVGLESAEALDGLFWSTFLPLPGNTIQPREVPDKTMQDYARFIENLLLDRGAQRYLSKMNQGVDKLAALAGFFERSVFLLPFRDPLQQAQSLARQHQKFSRLSAYQRQYFAWLGHHEFGSVHLRFTPNPNQAEAIGVRADLNDWLQQWHTGYTYLSQLTELYPNLLPVCYENMAHSASIWEDLSRRLGVGVSGDGFIDKNRTDKLPGKEVDSALLRACHSLYEKMSVQSRDRLCEAD